MKSITTTILLLALMAVVSGCVIAPREGYYDRGHQRYYHQNTWHDCGRADPHCR